MASPMPAAALACVLVLAAGCAAPGEDPKAAAEGCPPGVGEHRDDGEGYAYCVPAGWEPAQVGQVTAYVAPGSAADGFGENVNVVTEPVGAMGVEGYRDSSVAMLMEAIDGFELVRSGPFGLDGGEEAISAEYTGRQGQSQIHWFQVYAIHDGKAYVATYTAEEDAYGDYLEAAKQSFSTLRFP